MPGRVARTPKAVRDLQLNWSYLLEHGGTGIADRFLDAVERTSLMLLQTPFAGTLNRSSTPQTLGLRRFPVRLPFGTWLIVYLPTPKGITILRIAHGKRHPDALLP